MPNSPHSNTKVVLSFWCDQCDETRRKAALKVSAQISSTNGSANTLLTWGQIGGVWIIKPEHSLWHDPSWQLPICCYLATIGIFRSAETLHEEIVANLTFNPYGVDGTPLSKYVEEKWGEYLQRMAQHGTYGDHLTLQRASLIFNVQFLIVSTLGLDATSVISPSGDYCESLPLLVLSLRDRGNI